VPVVVSCLPEPVWDQFAAGLPERPEVAPSHPLGRHQRRIPDRLGFERVVAALVHGSEYERIATSACSDRTIRRRVTAWAGAGGAERPRTLVLQQYDRLIGLDLDGPSADGCLTPHQGTRSRRQGRALPRGSGQAGPEGGHCDRWVRWVRQPTACGFRRSQPPRGTDARAAAATLAGSAKLGHRPDDITAHLDRGYDSTSIRALLVRSGSTGEITRKGIPAPVRLGQRWVVGRANA
jgi:hypothetical protein